MKKAANEVMLWRGHQQRSPEAEEAMREREGEERQTFLLRFGDTLRSLTSEMEILQTGARLLGEHLDVDRCFFGELFEEQNLAIMHPDYARGSLASLAGRFKLSDFQETVTALQSGRPYVVPDVAQSALLSEHTRSAYLTIGYASFFSVPLFKRGTLVLNLSAVSSHAREWTSAEIQLTQEIAERTWTISERARAEAALRGSEERLKQMINVEGVGILTFASNGTLLSANDTFLDMMGYLREEIEGGTLTWRDFTPDEYVADSLAQLRQLEERGRIGPYEKEYFHKDGSRSWMLFAGAAVNNGTIVEYCIDVSDRKRAERAARESDQALRASEERLRRLNEELEDRVHARTAEINGLFKRLVTAQEEERRRIARDIHDQLGQQMTALRMNLESLRSRATGDAGFLDQMARTARLAEELDKSVDFLTWDLRPAALDHLGLSSALHNLVSGWSERFHIAAGFDASGDDRLRLPRDVEANLYRIAQEALHNVVEHAGATHVSVLLQQSDDETVLVIEDNGRGFGGSSGGAQMDDGGLGLVSMRERATIAGGRFEIESRPSGTAIFIRVPHIVESC